MVKFQATIIWVILYPYILVVLNRMPEKVFIYIYIKAYFCLKIKFDNYGILLWLYLYMKLSILLFLKNNKNKYWCAKILMDSLK